MVRIETVKRHEWINSVLNRIEWRTKSAIAMLHITELASEAEENEKKCNCTITNKFLSKMPLEKKAKLRQDFVGKIAGCAAKRKQQKQVRAFAATFLQGIFDLIESHKYPHSGQKVCGLVPQSFLYDLFILLPFLFLADFSSLVCSRTHYKFPFCYMTL